MMYRLSLFGDEIEMIDILDILTGSIIEKTTHITIFPAQAYVTPEDKLKQACANIRQEMNDRVL